MPKTRIGVGGKPLLQWNIELLRDQLGIRELYLIIGYLGEQIQHRFGDGSDLGVQIRYLQQRDRPGIGAALYVTKDVLQEPFVVILGDELYMDSNHRELARYPADYDAICGLIETPDKERISKNYTVDLADGRIASLVDKPRRPPTNPCRCPRGRLTSCSGSCGSWLLSPATSRLAIPALPTGIIGARNVD